jgi:prevent-host-death family protein
MPIASSVTKRRKRDIRTVSATEFKNRSLALLREVHQLREPVLITKRGKPVARLVPAGRPDKFIGRLKGKIRIVGDITSPVMPPDAWEYDRNNLD